MGWERATSSKPSGFLVPPRMDAWTMKPSFVAACARACRVCTRLRSRGNAFVRTSLSRPSSTDGAVFRVTLLNPLDKPEPAWSFKTEFLSDSTSDLVSRGVRGDKRDLTATAGLSALKLVELPSTNAAAVLLQTLQTYAIYCPNTPTLRATVQDSQMRPPVGLSGGGLAEAFQDVRKALGDDDERLDEVFTLIDWVRDISATDAASHCCLLPWRAARTSSSSLIAS